MDKRTIKFVCISDTHSQLGSVLHKIPDGDVLLHCGDFTHWGYPEEVKKFNKSLGNGYKIILILNKLNVRVVRLPIESCTRLKFSIT